MKIIPFQQHLRPSIPTVRGNVEYRRLEEQLVRMDEILMDSGIEDFFIKKSVLKYQEASKVNKVEAKVWQIRKHQETSMVALRCMILKSMLGVSCREMSIQLAQSQLYQWFCKLGRIDEVRVPSKSRIQSYIDIISEQDIKEVVEKLLVRTTELSLKEAIELDAVWFDSTCVKTNIHYPTDWVLLRDGTRTLCKAIEVIRKHGLKCRMTSPYGFLTKMNGMCMKMTHCKRKKDSKKTQKEILRIMKKLVTTVRKHAKRHYDLLEKEWEETDLSRKQADVVLRRIKNVLEQLPSAQKQAHDRIIGERQVDNKDKILSFYEKDTNVIVRGKAGADVEFGNTLYFAEEFNGLIIDWKFFKESAPADSNLMEESVLRIESSLSVKVTSACGDRGFDSKKNQKYLQNKEIYNGITPKDPHELKEKLNDTRFKKLQKRRASTEARVGVFKNCFLGKILKVKGFENRCSAIAWAVLAHNLWVLARLPKMDALKLAA